MFFDVDLVLSKNKSGVFTLACFCCSGVLLLLSLITNSSHLPFKEELKIVWS